MTLGKAFKQAIEDRNIRIIGGLVDICIFKHKMNYQEVFNLVKKANPKIDLASWDELLYEVDMSVS